MPEAATTAVEPIDVIAELTVLMDLHGGACKNEIRDLIWRLEAEAAAAEGGATRKAPEPAKK